MPTSAELRQLSSEKKNQQKLQIIQSSAEKSSNIEISRESSTVMTIKNSASALKLNGETDEYLDGHKLATVS